MKGKGQAKTAVRFEFVTELHLAPKTRKQAYFCYMHIDKFANQPEGGNKVAIKGHKKGANETMNINVRYLRGEKT